MKKILFALFSFIAITTMADDSIVVTAQPVIMQVNPLDTNRVGIMALEASFQFQEPKGLRVYPAHYIYADDGAINVFKKPDSYFLPKAALDVVAPGFFDMFYSMILSSLQGNAASLKLYNTNLWIKQPIKH